MRRAIFCLVFAVCSAVRATNAYLDDVTQVFSSPSPQAHQPWLDAIHNSHSSVFMEMFHLSDARVVDELIAAKNRNVRVQVILDRKGLSGGLKKTLYNKLLQAKVEVRPSSPAFSISHAKSMVIDEKIAFITSMNLTTMFNSTFDLGVEVSDESVVHDLLKVFQSDWDNYNNITPVTPQVSSPFLVVSPVNSKRKILDLIHYGTKSLQVTVENLGNDEIIGALIWMHSKGSVIQVLVPLCDENENPFYNFPALERLKKFVDVKVMPAPATPDQPYIHGKTIMAIGDQGPRVFVGSENFSNNSLMNAREIGILLQNAAVTQKFTTTFTNLWSAAIDVPPQNPSLCGNH